MASSVLGSREGERGSVLTGEMAIGAPKVKATHCPGVLSLRGSLLQLLHLNSELPFLFLLLLSTPPLSQACKRSDSLDLREMALRTATGGASRRFVQSSITGSSRGARASAR